MDELIGSLQAHEQIMKQNDDTGNCEQALQSKMSINENQASSSYIRGKGNHGGYRGGYIVGPNRRG